MSFLQPFRRSLQVLPGQLLGITAVQPSLLQLSLGSSSNTGVLLLQRCSSMLLNFSCSSTERAAGTGAGSSSCDPAPIATAHEEAAPNTSSATPAADPADGAAKDRLPSNLTSSSGWSASMLLPVSPARPAAAVQVRCAQSSSIFPAATTADSRPSEQAAAPMNPANSSSGGRGKELGKGRLGVAAAGLQLGTPRQQRWRPQSSYRGPTVSDRQLTVMLKGASTPQQLLQVLQQRQQQGGVLNAIHVAASYHHFGRMCQADAAEAGTAAAQQLLQQLDQLLPSVRTQLGAREHASIIWSCAYTKRTGPVAQLLPDFMQLRILQAASSQGVGNVLWALATLHWQVSQQQLLLLADALVRQADTAVPQDISNSVRALGKLGYQMPQQQLSVLLAAFTTRRMLDRAGTQAISNLLLGMAYMGQRLPDAILDQLQLLVAAFVSKRSRANPQELANFLWAMSDLQQQVHAEQLEPLLAAFEQQLHTAAPQAISNVLLACARFRYAPAMLLAACEQQQHMQQFLAGAKPQELANTACACVILGHNSGLLLGGVLQQAQKLLQQDNSRFGCRTLCALCWAVAVLDLPQYTPAALQFAQAASRVWGSAAPEDLQQLYQVHLWLQDLAAAEGGKGLGLLPVLSQQQLDGCRQAWQGQVVANATAASSSMQQQVFEALQHLPGWRVPPQQEKPTDDHNFSIDIFAVTAAGVRLAVEVDGPSHFVSPGNRVNGPTQYRNRALKARGYTVVSIPGREWAQLNGAEQQQQQYLKDKLRGVL